MHGRANFPSHLALIVVLVVAVGEMGGDYRRIISTVGVTPKNHGVGGVAGSLAEMDKQSWSWRGEKPCSIRCHLLHARETQMTDLTASLADFWAIRLRFVCWIATGRNCCLTPPS